MNLKEYQKKAVERLLEDSAGFLRREGDKTIVFKSPTGSGKTAMVANFLARLAEYSQIPSFACVWIAPLKLHGQSYDKLKRYYANSRALECKEFSDLQDNQIGDREILFVNWASVIQANNIIIRENEREFYLDKVVENTKAAGRAIILLIDESHSHARTNHAHALIDRIGPKLTVEISATPFLSKSAAGTVTVDSDEVVAEGMIKKSVVLNDGLRNKLELDGSVKIDHKKTADNVILKHALDRSSELADAFQKEGSGVNPLLCIQLPPDFAGTPSDIRREVISALRDEGIAVENGKLAIHLSEDKKNLENIARNDNEVEVIIFKQAIALGWDCPRAHILVLFRDWANDVFSVQTLGRIMRMPEPEIGHYENDILNNAYVYTNLPNVAIDQDVAGGIMIYKARRIEDYSPIKLPSWHSKGERDKTRLSLRFRELFLAAATKYDIKNKIECEGQNVTLQFISDFRVAKIDALTGESIPGDLTVNVENPEDLQKLFDYFARKNLAPLKPDSEGRSINQIKKAIYAFFDGPLQMGFVDHFSEIIKIVLSKTNKEHFVNVLHMAKEDYQTENEKRKNQLIETPEWEVPEFVEYGENYSERPAKKSIMKPFYASNRQSNMEQEFIEWLEKSSKVEWWFKNGIRESKYFAISYSKGGEQRLFYVDFIVQLTDGTIGLYDTKGDITIALDNGKSDGLQEYISRENAKGKKLIGGIVTFVDNNVWKIYKGKGAALNSEDLSNWVPLKI